MFSVQNVSINKTRNDNLNIIKSNDYLENYINESLVDPEKFSKIKEYFPNINIFKKQNENTLEHFLISGDNLTSLICYYKDAVSEAEAEIFKNLILEEYQLNDLIFHEFEINEDVDFFGAIDEYRMNYVMISKIPTTDKYSLISISVDSNQLFDYNSENKFSEVFGIVGSTISLLNP